MSDLSVWIRKDEQINGFMPWKWSFTFSNSKRLLDDAMNIRLEDEGCFTADSWNVFALVTKTEKKK